jgi:hypothetical protein
MQLFKRVMWTSAVIFVIAACEREANAQYGAPSVRNNFRDATIRRSTVSPYLGLFERSGTGTTPYYSFVKPRIEQDADNRRFQQQNAELRQQLNQVSVQANAQQQAGRLPTGHRTTYMYYSHYFTMPQR